MSLDFDPGTTVTRAAEMAAAEAARTGRTVCTSFNGTPMVACPGDVAATVQVRWHYERRLIQAGITPER